MVVGSLLQNKYLCHSEPREGHYRVFKNILPFVQNDRSFSFNPVVRTGLIFILPILLYKDIKKLPPVPP